VNVRIRLFASLREALGGEDHIELELPDEATAEDAWRRLVRHRMDMAAKRHTMALAINRRYAPFDTRLNEGDEVVFMPPVSGGSQGA
jgi:molybdopterin converting factor subunit 1